MTLGDGVASQQLNKDFTNSLPETFEALKWVTPDRMSPNFDGGTSIHYAKGKVVCAEGLVSDQQCAKGLHVLRAPYRPEWVGLAGTGHNLICLRVRIRREDVLFGGLPTMDAKLRVSKLEVLD